MCRSSQQVLAVDLEAVEIGGLFPTVQPAAPTPCKIALKISKISGIFYYIDSWNDIISEGCSVGLTSNSVVIKNESR